MEESAGTEHVAIPISCTLVKSWIGGVLRNMNPTGRLKLSAEMKVPGRAWLEFEVEPCDQGSIIRQTAIFDPVGFWGLAYWYGIYPLHALIFRGMLRRIAREAERRGDKAKPS